MELPSITVITVTRGRPQLLRRAMASLRTQDYKGLIKHNLLIDDCQMTAAAMNSSTDGYSGLFRWQLISRTDRDHDGPARLAQLRNLGVREANSDYVAFLDDDNEIEHSHLSSLVDCAMRTGCRAVHSWRQIFLHDGSPYLEARMPWKRDYTEGRQLYQELTSKGIFEPGSNIVRDRVDARDHPDPARMVDLGEWLFEYSLLVAYPFCEQYSHQDWLDVTPEDNKLLQTLVNEGVVTASIGMPSLRYYLGGYSNSFHETHGTSLIWNRP